MTDATTPFRPLLGATPADGATTFRVRAPGRERIDLVLLPDGASFDDARGRLEPMTPDAGGLFTATIDGIGDGARYGYRVEGRGPFPDPASRWQPDGVHGPSAVIDWTRFAWTDHDWQGIPLERTVLYELHVGTFTPDGTFAGAADRLGDLVDLGVTAVELMPVADFPGRRNWGYDGVSLFAPSRAYGTPDDFRRFVDRAHTLGLAVHLDVVYNHLGPDGAYQSTFNPRFYSATHQSPWGAGINFDGPGSGAVREYFVENALRWVHEYHIDGLRLDATNAIADDSPVHIVAELTERVRASVSAQAQPPGGSPDRIVVVIAEDERNLNTIVRPRQEGGWGLDGIWIDDLHHELRVALGGDRDGYFADYDGSMEAIATTARQGWFYTGQYSAHKGALRGTDPTGIALARSIVCLQNHDQVGNRAFGDRLHHTIDIASWHAATALLLALPETPLLFMGQEWAATSPFQYFTDHNEQLGRLVTEGRRREFGRFTAFADPVTRDTIPDPQAESTFTASRLDWDERAREPHASTLALYRRLLALRRSSPAMADARGFAIEPAGSDGLVVRRGEGEGTLLFFVRLRGAGGLEVGDDIVRPPAGCAWQVVLATADCSPGASAPGQVTGADVGGRGFSLAGPSGLKAGPPFVLKAGPPFVRPGAIVFEAVAEEAV